MSTTTARFGNDVRSMSSSDSPTMPREVVLTRSPASRCTTVRPCQVSVYEPDPLDLSLAQCRDNRPRRAAGAENDRRPCRRFPIRGTFAQILAKPENIGIATFEAAIGCDNYRVHRPDAARQWRNAINDRQCRLFVRQRQIAAAEAQRRQRP